MTHVLAIFAVWSLLTVMGLLISTPEWFPYLFGALLGCWAQAMIDVDSWYWGVGIGGAAGFLVLISDVLLVTADAIRAGVLVRLGRRG